MPYHEWGDESFDWDSLYKAERIGNKMMRKLGRIGVHSKEKYSTIRWSLFLFDGSLHSFTHPGHVYSRYPKWLWKLNCKYKLPKLLRKPIQTYQKLVVRFTFRYLCNRFPHIADEILMDAPRELLPDDLRKRAGKLWQTTCKTCNIWYTCDNEHCPTCGG